MLVFGSVTRGTDTNSDFRDADFLVEFVLYSNLSPLERFFYLVDALREA